MKLGFCEICQKQYKNIDLHDFMRHREEINPPVSPAPPSNPPQIIMRDDGSTEALIRRKLNLIMDIKIMEMLTTSKQSGVNDLVQVQQALNPPKSASVGELKEMFKLFNDMKTELAPELEQYADDEEMDLNTGDPLIDMLGQFLPLIKAKMGAGVPSPQAIDVPLKPDFNAEMDKEIARVMNNEGTNTGTPTVPANPNQNIA